MMFQTMTENLVGKYISVIEVIPLSILIVMHFAPLNIFENQVIQVGIYNILKNFLTEFCYHTSAIIGHKVLPKWIKLKHLTFSKGNEFKHKMNNNVYLLESKPTISEKSKLFQL